VDLALYAGDGAAFRLTVTDALGDAFDASGVVVAQIRKARGDVAPVDTFVVDDTDAVEGVLVLRLTGAQTAALLETPGTGKFSGVWDCQLTTDDDEPRTLLQGKVSCVPDVSR